MKKSFHCLFISLLLGLFWGSLFSPAGAHFKASPFIADSGEDNGDFTAKIVSTANHILYHVADNRGSLPCGVYAGVLVTPWRPFRGLHTISFLSRGGCHADDASQFQPGVIVEYGSAGKIIDRVFVPCSQAKATPAEDGFVWLTFSGKQFGLSSSSVIHDIVISDPFATEPGSFNIGNILVNDQFAHPDYKDNTKFFSVTNCSPTGPLGDMRTALQGSGGGTQLILTNSTGSSVNAYLTLGAAAPNTPCESGTCVQDVTQVFSGMTQFGGALVGKITLSPGQTVSYTGGQTIQGNIAFDDVFQNCPRAGFPNGMNCAEITLNPSAGPNSQFPFQEAVDISCVAGVNADINMAMSSTTWSNGVVGVVTGMENGTLDNNLNKPGVFPPGCDDCQNRTNINPPPCFAGRGCDSNHICNIQRDRNLAGGTVTVMYKGKL